MDTALVSLIDWRHGSRPFRQFMSSQSLNQIRAIRLEKAAALRAKGLDPYPSVSRRTKLWPRR